MTALRYLLSAYRLKDRPRSGWRLRGVPDGESVGDHTWGTALLCMLYAGDAGVDRLEALEIALVHDLAEAEIGDLPSLADPDLRPVGEAEKARLERHAMDALTASWPAGAGPASGASAAAERVMRRWRAYEDRDGPAARFVRDMNLLDMCLQALVYERSRRYDPEADLPAFARHPHLDEFFASAEARVVTPFGRARVAEVAAAYREVRNEVEAPAGGASTD